MLMRCPIFSASLVSVIILAQTTQACEISTCVFNKEYNGKKKVIKIQAPKQEKWVSSNKLDAIDKIIFGEVSIPHRYQDITQAPKKNVYVKSEKYQKLIITAQEQLHNKQQALDNKLKDIGNDIKQAGDFMTLTLAKDRVAEYEKILKEHDCFRHVCSGIILTMQTKRCIALWAFWNKKQS